MSAMTNTWAAKEKLVAEILKNPTYTPESVVYCRLRDVLMKLAKDDLACLKLVIDQRALNELSK